MHYSTGAGGLASLGGAGLVAGWLGAERIARALLEAAGAIFAVYLGVMVALSLWGAALRRRARTSTVDTAGGRRRPRPWAVRHAR